MCVACRPGTTTTDWQKVDVSAVWEQVQMSMQVVQREIQHCSILNKTLFGCHVIRKQPSLLLPVMWHIYVHCLQRYSQDANCYICYGTIQSTNNMLRVSSYNRKSKNFVDTLARFKNVATRLLSEKSQPSETTRQAVLSNDISGQ